MHNHIVIVVNRAKPAKLLQILPRCYHRYYVVRSIIIC